MNEELGSHLGEENEVSISTFAAGSQNLADSILSGFADGAQHCRSETDVVEDDYQSTSVHPPHLPRPTHRQWILKGSSFETGQECGHDDPEPTSVVVAGVAVAFGSRSKGPFRTIIKPSRKGRYTDYSIVVYFYPLGAIGAIFFLYETLPVGATSVRWPFVISMTMRSMIRPIITLKLKNVYQTGTT